MLILCELSLLELSFTTDSTFPTDSTLLDLPNLESLFIDDRCFNLLALVASNILIDSLLLIESKPNILKLCELPVLNKLSPIAFFLLGFWI